MKKRHPLWKTMAVLGTAVLSVEAVNRAIFSYKSGQADSFEGDHFLEWKQGRICYRKKERGAGYPILLIHDLYPDQSMEQMEKLAVQLSQKRTVYMMDLLGCGHSEKPAVTYTNFLYVMQITEMIEKVIRQPVHLTAKGRSAAIAIAAARYKPEYFSQLTLLDPIDFQENKQLPDLCSKWKKRLIELPVFGTLIYNMQFMNSASAHLGGTSARYLYASIAGRYTNYDVEWMLESNEIPVHIVRTEM